MTFGIPSVYSGPALRDWPLIAPAEGPAAWLSGGRLQAQRGLPWHRVARFRIPVGVTGRPRSRRQCWRLWRLWGSRGWRLDEPHDMLRHERMTKHRPQLVDQFGLK